MSELEPKHIAIVVLLVALVVVLHVAGVLAGRSAPTSASPRDDRGWPDVVGSVLHGIPGLARDLAPEDVTGRPCVEPDGDTVALVGCDGLVVPDGVDRVVLRLSDPACTVRAITPGQLVQSYAVDEVDDDGLLRVPIAGDGTVLRLTTATGMTPCRVLVAGT